MLLTQSSSTFSKDDDSDLSLIISENDESDSLIISEDDGSNSAFDSLSKNDGSNPVSDILSKNDGSNTVSNIARFCYKETVSRGIGLTTLSKVSSQLDNGTVDSL